ncbi:LacI family DNA-binding transcriptional regulator [Occultella kanbiaonis]|uniref:LacI family DNA-binding transcriptional regulator n=1 Tax=Occultella kanbiaonis TaxID=2675754 RepID=UPI0013D1757A|nr:LacI family DNA-binding transcriptional regulator [Occultella kanbiaonis]
MNARADRPGSRPATIIDVAEAAGVSRQTVTRAMNDMPGIKEATKERVLAAAKELAYRPSRFGRGLVGHTQRTVGLVVDDLMNPYYPQLASAVVSSARDRGWNVVLAQTAKAADQYTLIADLAKQADVVVGYPALTDTQAQEVLAGVPFVRIDMGEYTYGGGIQMDVGDAMGAMADHLLDRGSRRPVLLDVGLPGFPSARGKSFLAAMAARGVQVPTVSAASKSLSSGVAGANALLEAHPDVDAIMTFNDIVACGALKALHEAGVDVPGQVRLAGCDGLNLGRFVSPELTTLAVDMGAVAEAAVGMALAMYAGEVPLQGARAQVAHHLLVRAST